MGEERGSGRGESHPVLEPCTLFPNPAKVMGVLG